MVHKEEYQRRADAEAMKLGGMALHVGKIGEDEFVYALKGTKSIEDSGTLIVVQGDEVRVVNGVDDVKAIEAEMTPKEFYTGREIFKKYKTMIKNHSQAIGTSPEYAQMIVNAVESKEIKPAEMYQYLELAERWRKKISIAQEGGKAFIELM